MEEIITKLNFTISEFSRYIQSLPVSKWKLSTTSKWGPIEVLCHLTFWHEQYCSILKDLLNEREPNMLEGTFKSHNALSVELNKNKSREELINRLQNAQEKLALLCKNPKAEKVKIAFKVGGKSRPLLEALTLIEGHIKSHQRQLVRAGFK